MSEAMHAVQGITQNINDLDTVMSEEGADGSRLHASMLRVDRDPTQVRYINSIIGKVNGEAIEIINEAAQSLIIIGKNLKNLIEDVQKKHPELLINWREVNLASKEPMNQRMVNSFKKINYFVQLMRLCTQ
jgi:predicted metallo-beta-lactamase superfamily hydrolase